MTTLTGLADIGAISSGENIGGLLGNGAKELRFGSIRYIADEGGLLISEEADQLVLVEDADKEYYTVTVTAIPEYGYEFLRWSDHEPNIVEVQDGPFVGYIEIPDDPTRTDSFKISKDGTVGDDYDNLDEEKVVHAIFVEYDDSNPAGEGGESEGNNNTNEDMPNDMPPSDKSANGEADTDREGGMDKIDTTWDDSANQFEDGDTYYRTKYDQYLEQARRYLEEGKEIPPALKALIELYANTIA